MQRPQKPYPEFPLTACTNGQWRKIVKGQPYYFGSWRTDPKGENALRLWLARKEAILAGLYRVDTTPSNTANDLTVGELVNKYLAIRGRDVEAGRIAPGTYGDYMANLKDFADFVGPRVKVAILKPGHFSAYRATLELRKLGAHATRRVIVNVKTAFKYAVDDGWITSICFGRAFVAPQTDSEAVALSCLRAGKENRTERILVRREVRRLLRATTFKPKWRAIVLLMLNAAMNPAEIARLKWAEINFKSGRLRRRRWKTGILQEAYLWKITRKALEALPRDDAEWVFVRPNGQLLVNTEPVKGKKGSGEEAIVHIRRSNRISRPFRDLAEAAGIERITPYTLRRTARTVAAHCPDDNAAKRMMGQRLTGRDNTYIKGRFPLARLKAIARTLHDRLVAAKPQAPKDKGRSGNDENTPEQDNGHSGQ
ncbi:MAG: tyrosine-type recombinase/integrase [Bacillota bacterium]